MDEVHSSPTLAGVLTRLREGRRGDPDLERRLNEVFARYETRLLALCRKDLRGFAESQVEEVAQDVLLEAWAKLEGYQPERGRFVAFLTGIARYKCANARRRIRYLFWEDLRLEEPASPARDALQQLTDQEQDLLVQESAKSVLDEREQAVVHLRWILDYDYEAIAAQLQYHDVNEVRVAHQRCLRRMAKEVERRLAQRGHGPSFLRS